jgi:hypothetical protein
VVSSAISMVAGRKKALLFSFMLVGFLSCLGCVPAVYESPGEQTSDDVQYLSAYGDWIDVQPFGMVWHPNVVSGWEPFYYGHWVWTNDGWAWVSYEPYGWLVYHYGYWDYSPDIGWFWVPDDTWSPAQVEWYTFGGYTAWAPLPPPNVFWPQPWEPYHTNVWIIVDDDRFTDDNVGHWRVKEPPQRDIIQRGPISTRPPGVGEIEKLTKRTIPTVRIRKETMNIRQQTIPPPPEQVKRTEEPKLRKMVLPDGERQKVTKYAPQVEREILAPRREAPPPSKQREQELEKKQQEQGQQQEQQKQVQEKQRQEQEQKQRQQEQKQQEFLKQQHEQELKKQEQQKQQQKQQQERKTEPEEKTKSRSR